MAKTARVPRPLERELEALAGFVERRPLEVSQDVVRARAAACCSQTGSSKLTVLPSSGRWLLVGRPFELRAAAGAAAAQVPLTVVSQRCDARRPFVRSYAITALWLQNMQAKARRVVFASVLHDMALVNTWRKAVTYGLRQNDADLVYNARVNFRKSDSAVAAFNSHHETLTTLALASRRCAPMPTATWRGTRGTRLLDRATSATVTERRFSRSTSWIQAQIPDDVSFVYCQLEACVIGKRNRHVEGSRPGLPGHDFPGRR